MKQKLKEFFELKVTFLKAIAALCALSIYFHLTGQTAYQPGMDASILTLILIHLSEPLLQKGYDYLDRKEAQKQAQQTKEVE